MNTPSLRFLSAAALLAVLAACGNKGPLVLPQKPIPVEEPALEPPPANTDPVPASTTDPVQDTVPEPARG
ncbi:lipoprotein [Xanthomonas sp. XNM01]|uniref:LPS translocon maturation chaperone LptM n=1 Tax=Xanthomonas sp. XNM01 TaxID=2769289 RepID=UPI001785E38F|nr:lipoprotein [Xanthomonas sp. XNM01]MBD9369981.1 lipoprotein [Xanthomonas sp. XNM01]